MEADTLFDNPKVGEPDATVEITAGIAQVNASVALFDKIRAGIAAIQAAHPADLAIDVTQAAGMKQAIAGRAAWRTPRIALGKARQEAKAPVLALGRQIDAFAANVEAQLRVGESHYHQMIEAEEERRAREREERARAEQARIDGLRARVAAISGMAQRAAGMAPPEIEALIAELERTEITGFEEYAGMAYEAKDGALRALRDLHAKAVQSQEQAARLAQLEAEVAERKRVETAEREQRERVLREAEAKTSAAARELSDEIRRIQRRGFSVSAQGMLELVTLIENIVIDDTLGRFGLDVQVVKDEALADLHQMHAQKVQAEAELQAARAESERLERLAEQRRAELARMDAPQAGTAGDGSQTPDGGTLDAPAKAGQDAPEGVLCAGDAQPCTDTVAEAAQATAVGDEGQTAHAEERAVEPATVSLGKIAQRLGFTLTQAFVEGTLGIPSTGRDKRAVLWRESQWLEIKAALVRHIEALT